MKPLELLLEGWFEVECVLVSLWTPGMIGPKTCPPWVDHSDTDPLLWNRMFRASFSVVFGWNHTLAPALASVSAEIWRSLILGWEPGSVAANWASPLLLMVSGRLASLFTGFVGKGGWEAACRCWACRGERMTPRTAAPRFEVVPSLGSFVLPRIPFWNATSRSIFSEEDTECFGGFNLTPRRFYKVFPFLWFVFDILELLNADNKLWKPLNTWVVSQRHRGTVFSVWWRMQKVMVRKTEDGASCQTHALTFKHRSVRIKTNNSYSHHINALTGSKRHGWKEQTGEKIFHIRHLRKQKCINEWETVGRRWGFSSVGTVLITKDIFISDGLFFLCVFLFQARWWFM